MRQAVADHGEVFYRAVSIHAKEGTLEAELDKVFGGQK